MSVNVYVVRHGQTMFNLYHRMQGWSDSPLTESGIKDAVRAGKALAHLHLDYVFTSDLRRAVDTAKWIMKQHDADNQPAITQDIHFREVNLGFMEGEPGDTMGDILSGKWRHYHSWAEFMQDYTMAQARDIMHEKDPYHLAESNDQFISRIKQGVDRLRRLPDGSNVLLVDHGLVVRSLMELYASPDVYDGTEAPKNAHISKMVLDGDKTTVEYFNRVDLP
ncbi:histidine phosphatase family protein [Limosilactobacillus sp.]|uniref:histidine phosphatase family protein n=1 Tax=Limosilactobacillus sp. TaxID=2773925 RepID=UPI00345EA52F